MPVLSLEASTSSAKAMLYEEHRGVLAVESLPYAADVFDVTTFDPPGVVDTVLHCAAQLLARYPGIEVEAIGLSSIWHSLVMLDEHDRPLGRGQTWADTTAAPTAAPFRQDQALARRVYQSTGCPVHSSYNGWKWMHRRRTGDVSAVRRVSCLPEYLFFGLTGEFAITRSVAAGSAMLCAHTLDWDNGMLDLFGLRPEMLGRLVEPDHCNALNTAAAARLGLPAGTPVVATGADGALNHIAASALADDVMTLSVGTSGALRIANHGAVLPQRPSTWCYYLAEGLHLVGAATSGAGNCVKWFTDELLGGSWNFAQLEDAARCCNAEMTPYFLPFNFGERCPGWNDARQGGFQGIGPSAGVGAMYRAVLEGILFNLYQNYRILVDTMGREPSMISISGGITKSPLWMALAADTFGVVLDENTGEHASLLGAAHMARRAAGHMGSLRQIAPEPGPRHAPDLENHRRILQRLDRWMEYYETGADL